MNAKFKTYFRSGSAIFYIFIITISQIFTKNAKFVIFEPFAKLGTSFFGISTSKIGILAYQITFNRKCR